MGYKTCFFLGHRDAPESIRPALERAVERHVVQFGVTDFVVGRYGKFDAMSAHAVADAKMRHPPLPLTLLLPYYVAEPKKIAHAELFDDTFYPPGMERVPRRLAILRANRYMVMHSDYLISYGHTPGTTKDLVDYAIRREKRE